ncbi:MAG: hypothetical protein BWY78_01308 [Alphaproteobacteria bacterium ADurb.Bin438]|nr:MAG: hypothetical protein BWY78_01308 [Alphaproteobacteria bacterium ADurb.Bin438]
MSEQRDSFIFYRSFYEALKELPDDDRLALYDAIAKKSLDFEDTDLTGIRKALFTLISPQIEANQKRFFNGKQPKDKQKESINETNNKQEKSKTEANNKQTISKAEANNNVNVNVNVKEKNIINNIPKEKTKSEVLENDFEINENLKPSFERWIDYRKKIKKPIKSASLKACYEQLCTLSSFDGEIASLVVNQSIANGYQGLFELKTQKQYPRGQPLTNDVDDDGGFDGVLGGLAILQNRRKRNEGITDISL